MWDSSRHQAMLLDEMRFMVSDWAPTEPLTSQDEVDKDANIHDAWMRSHQM